MKQKTVLAALEPEVVERLVSRREAVMSAGKLGLALASAPVARRACFKCLRAGRRTPTTNC